MSLDAFTPLHIPRLSGPVDDPERERARRRGHAAGYAEGMRAARAAADRDREQAEAERRAAADAAARAVATSLTALDQAMAALAATADDLAAPAAHQIMGLAVELAETILERELAVPVRAALTAATRAAHAAEAHATIVLSRADLAVLDELDRRPDAPVEASDELTPGDALVRLPDGEVDLRIAAALARARAALAEVA